MFGVKAAQGGSAHRGLPVFLFGLLAMVASPADVSAQPYPAYRVYPEAPMYQQPRIPPHEAAAIVRSLGLMPTSAPRPRGPFWVVDAVGQDGSPIKVRVDAINGRVADIVRVPGPRMVRVYPGSPPGTVYEAPPPGAVYGAPAPRGGQPGYYNDDEDDYPLKDSPGYGPQRNPNYYGGDQRGSIPPRGPNVITRDGDVTNSVPQRQVSRTVGHDPLLGVPKEFRGEQKPKTEQKKTAAKPDEKTPASAPLPKPRPADAPAVAKTETKPAETAPVAAPKKQEAVKPDLSKPSQHPVQGLE
jgi:hypothetical protein